MKIIKKGLSIILNRFVITVALILIQMGLITFYVLKLADYSTWIYPLMIAGSVGLTLFVIWREDNPAYKIGWIMLLCLLPVFGGMMYVFFGNKRPSKSLNRKIQPVEEKHWDDLKQVDDFDNQINARKQGTMKYVAETGHYPAWKESDVRYFSSGEKMFPALLEDLRKAERFIFIEFFIINEGRMWDEIFDIIKEKAKQGVDVRVTYDDVGSIKGLPKGFLLKLREAGIKVLTFNPLKPFVSLIYNNRDHRKIIVIDGNVGYSGGVNISDEYINEKTRFGYWKDTAIRIEGKAVWNFSVMFLNMWNAFKPTEECYDHFRPNRVLPEAGEDVGYVQPYSDTPLDDENLGENVYLEIISCAERYVYIFTPYLIIDNEMKTALTTAAKRGVDVRIVTPAIPDKKIIFRLTRSYYEPLLKAGVKIYEFTPGFIHAKSFIADDNIGVVGTINMDYRSLFLHFECGTLLVNEDCLADLKQDCIDTMAQSKQIKHEDCKRTFIGLLVDSVLRALSPLL
ncbi:MAG: cardiolipin synthase [Eubacteriaceae bacterium]|nr:cardiolipin synthase [Eubacteriaceae bacterium]